VSELLTAFGLVAIIEGLVIALAPNRFEDILKFLAEMQSQDRRWLGFIFIALGAIWIYVVSILTA